MGSRDEEASITDASQYKKAADSINESVTQFRAFGTIWLEGNLDTIIKSPSNVHVL